MNTYIMVGCCLIEKVVALHEVARSCKKFETTETRSHFCDIFVTTIFSSLLLLLSLPNVAPKYS
jgi:hypothetical protein